MSMGARRFLSTADDWWGALTYTKRRKVLLAAGVLFVTSFLLGLYLGKTASPDYTTEDGVRIFIASRLRATRIDIADVELELILGPVAKYSFKLSNPVVSVSLPPPDVVAKLKPHGHDLMKDSDRLLALVGITAAPAGTIGAFSGVTAAVSAAPRLVRRAAYVATAVLALTGGGLGYRMGYRSEPDSDDRSFSKAIREPGAWLPYAQALNVCVVKLEVIQKLEAIRGNTEQTDQATMIRKAAAEEGARCRSLIDWVRREH